MAHSGGSAVIELALWIIGPLFGLWLLASVAFTGLSLGQTLVDLPQRFFDHLAVRKYQRERRQIDEALDRMERSQ
jgi:hypothetical protein